MVTVKGKKPENQNFSVLIAAAMVAIAAAVVYRWSLPQSHPRPSVSTATLSAGKTDGPVHRVQDPWSGALPNAHPSVTAVSQDTRTQLAALNEILATHNDNDPRLDQVLRNFTPEAKEKLKERYKELPSEDRNGRGTVVFLLGREIQAPEDAAFLADVLAEKPCLSLSDCSKETSRSAETHHDDLTNITLNYPQLVAVISMEKLLERSGGHLGPSMKDALIRAAKTAEASPVAAIARHGRELESHLESSTGG